MKMTSSSCSAEKSIQVQSTSKLQVVTPKLKSNMFVNTKGYSSIFCMLNLVEKRNFVLCWHSRRGRQTDTYTHTNTFDFLQIHILWKPNVQQCWMTGKYTTMQHIFYRKKLECNLVYHTEERECKCVRMLAYFECICVMCLSVRACVCVCVCADTAVFNNNKTCLNPTLYTYNKESKNENMNGKYSAGSNFIHSLTCSMINDGPPKLKPSLWSDMTSERQLKISHAKVTRKSAQIQT